MSKKSNNNPVITIIVPVYNGEKFIAKCLNSLVYQTLKEIEIIVVDNGSTDSTYKILQRYQNDFENVYVYQICHTDGPGGGRNEGLRYAKGQYIIFADADDYFDYYAMEKLYKEMKENPCDVLCFPSYEVRGNQVKVTRRHPNPTVESMLANGSMVFWNKLIKKEMYDKCGEIPEDYVFEDLAYITVLISFAEKIRYYDCPLYYYIIRDDSSVNSLNSIRNLDSIKACRYALANINQKYREIFLFSVAKRIRDDIYYRWPFADCYIQYLSELKSEILSNSYLYNDSYKDSILQILDVENPIDQALIVNGFGRKIDDSVIEELVDKVFFAKENTKVIILNTDNCDVHMNEFTKYAYENKEWESLGHYFALRNIYDNGGFYVDTQLKFSSYLNCLRYVEMFFGYMSKKTFSDKVFGGKKGNALCYDLMQSYENGVYYNNPCLPLAKRIRNILTLKYRQSLDGKTYYGENYCLLANNILSIDIQDKNNICYWTNYDKVDDDHFICVEKGMLNDLVKYVQEPIEQTVDKKYDAESIAKKLVEEENIFYSVDKELEKTNKKNLIPIVMSSSNYFVPYLSVLIQSIIENSNNDNYYDLIVLNKDIKYLNMVMLNQMIRGKDNFKLRFYNVNNYIEKRNFQVREHFTIETYFRMFVPYILKDYDKALYLDSDMVVNADPAKMYLSNLEGNILGVTHDAIMVASYNYPGSKQQIFLDTELNLKNPLAYFQAGSCLMDLNLYRKFISEDDLVEKICENRWMYGDQDVLNLLFEENVKYLEMNWNYTIDVLEGRRTRLIDGYAPDEIKKEFHQAKKNPYIIHYAGPQKPWNGHEAEYMNYFWKYAANSPYYRELLVRIMPNPGSTIRDTDNILLDLKKWETEVSRNKMKIEKYRIEINRLLDVNKKLEKEKRNLLLGISNYENSFFWKLTAPIRKLLDIIKKKG